MKHLQMFFCSINFLQLFHNLHWILIDPKSFSISETDHLNIRQELFTDEVAEEIAKTHQNILFISDIRTEPNDDQHCIKVNIISDLVFLCLKYAFQGYGRSNALAQYFKSGVEPS